jgi:hypothetical protein
MPVILCETVQPVEAVSGEILLGEPGEAGRCLRDPRG